MTPPTKRNQYSNKAKLLVLVSQYASIFAVVFGVICYFFLNIKGIIPLSFFTYALLLFINVLALKKHENLLLTYNIASILTTINGIVITLASGGIQSPFIFVLGVVVFAGFVNTKVYGGYYLLINLLLISLIFLHDLSDFRLLANTVPEESGNWFAFLSVLASIYLLGGVFGKNLLEAHHNLYKSQKEIASRIEEKETLLKEVHHRVKNNLQTISSLLNMQSRNIKDEEIKTLFKGSQNRVVSMAIVHEMLYGQDESLSKIAVKPYVQELCDYLFRSLKVHSKNIESEFDIPDISLSIDTVIPLGIIINETVTNALKYAFPENRSGKIKIKIKEGPEGKYTLGIRDNGVGFCDKVVNKKRDSLGLRLINNLTRQLKGNIKRTNKKGTRYKIQFEEIIESIS
ncbi:sensor histidine kinase [Croceivirga thetidis]|uniref:histidine kinase n=1 Tax=Croceivirga thetidis TaxID=2721623 RepID=A0ABX1GVE2_9FLAO|nr:sensor histidine kinase [Croceivirga thetidis]NKI32880.1 sensor histidine kinase [Croceivirga thetidis]